MLVILLIQRFNRLTKIIFDARMKKRQKSLAIKTKVNHTIYLGDKNREKIESLFSNNTRLLRYYNNLINTHSFTIFYQFISFYTTSLTFHHTDTFDLLNPNLGMGGNFTPTPTQLDFL